MKSGNVLFGAALILVSPKNSYGRGFKNKIVAIAET